MSRRRLAPVPTLIVGLALAAILPVPCSCLPAPVTAAEHTCCSPPAGINAAGPGCCAAALDVAREVVATPAGPPAAAPPLVVVACVEPPVIQALDRTKASPDSPVSPPLTVRRL